MKLVVNGKAYPLHGWMHEWEYDIIGHLYGKYYLCKIEGGKEVALYLPNVDEYYPRVH